MNIAAMSTVIAAAKEEILRLRRREDELVALLQHRALPLLEKHAQPYNHEHRACELIRAAISGSPVPLCTEPFSVRRLALPAQHFGSQRGAGTGLPTINRKDVAHE